MWYGEVTERMDIADLYSSILTRSFPPAELSGLEDILDGLEGGVLTVIGAREGDRWVGVAVTRTFSSGVVLLEWLAAVSTERSRGIGRALLERVGASAQRRGQLTFLAEIEPPGAGSAEGEYGDAGRRARFYQTAGAKALQITHYQPPVSPGSGYVPLILIAVPGAGLTLGASIPAAPIREFEIDYHGGRLDDPRVRESLDSLLGDVIALQDLGEIFR